MELELTGRVTSVCRHCGDGIEYNPAHAADAARGTSDAGMPPAWLHCKTGRATCDLTAAPWEPALAPDHVDDVEHHYGRARFVREKHFGLTASRPPTEPATACRGFWPKTGTGNAHICGGCGVALADHPVVVQ